MKRKVLIFLNILICIPAILFGMVAMDSLEAVWIIILIFSIINACVLTSEKEFIIFSSAIYLVSIISILINFFMMKAYGVGYHPEKIEELKFILGVHSLYVICIVCFELFIKHFMEKID